MALASVLLRGRTAVLVKASARNRFFRTVATTTDPASSFPKLLSSPPSSIVPTRVLSVSSQAPRPSSVPVPTGVFSRLLPPSLLPYYYLARVDKPIGTLLLLYPCLWSVSLATPGTLPPLGLVALYAAGSFIMRGAGCTINDMWDKEFDKKVERTKDRPLARGDLTMRQATGFLGLQLTAGLGVLLSVPHLEYCFILGCASLPLVVLYPTAKRWTDYPQVLLGMTFNWGALMGWSSIQGSLALPVLPLYVSCLSWTLVYDTLYAHQDASDDAALGLKSTALTFGVSHTKPVLLAATAVFGAGLIAAGHMAGIPLLLDETAVLAGAGAGAGAAGLGGGQLATAVKAACLSWGGGANLPFLGGVAACTSHLGWQVASADFNDRKNLDHRFKSNGKAVGLGVWAAIVGGGLLA